MAALQSVLRRPAADADYTTSSSYRIAGAVIGGTSLSGGVGTVFGTMIGVFIMSVLRTGLPSMDLQAHYQTFFTGVVVIDCVR